LKEFSINLVFEVYNQSCQANFSLFPPLEKIQGDIEIPKKEKNNKPLTV
jgi:hypothetical protein